ncbi:MULTISPECIES: UvrD-helicase domain-containing protein [unclassified Psychrobacter]|uniref:UvrD-helicase domain-containing protein n=1 Tax=unclassified Psychrobacter TaxID=196806 RepID=UPI003FD0128F
MKVISSEDWLPSDSLELEDNALDAVKSMSNCLILAGPGAGKTEMLAQRASYLLETNTCKYPRKILAISFKRDASYNLNERVEKRCGDELVKRFDSLTFDSFAKQILDRFKKALPNGVNVADQYEVLLGDKEILELYEREGTTLHSYAIKKQIMKTHNEQLLTDFSNSPNDARKRVWLQLLNSNPSKLSFPMIMRLAELIINTNPKIKKYLQMTYQFVFLDEFQDTTDIQYDLFQSCFINSSSTFTAVGDDKQRIMLWAGAKETVFQDFINDAGAKQINLHMNYRSAPKIVNLLNYFSEHLLRDNHKATPSTRWEVDQGECNICFFNSPENEKRDLLVDVNRWITQDSIDPRDICILVKQQLDVYVGEMIGYFCKNNIKTRNEDNFYDILTEEISIFIVNMMYRCLDNTNTETRKQTFDFISYLYSELDNQKLLNMEKKLFKFIKYARNKYDFDNLTFDTIKALLKDARELVDERRLKAQFPKYKNQIELDKLLKKLDDELWKAYQISESLETSLDTLLGKDTIPVMTIHKSKGLEYHTVVFIGLEDGAFWTYKNQSNEDNRAFFVALSRAKKRVIFTFSKERQDKFGRVRNQSFENIRPILDTMNSSGLVNIDNRMSP